MKKMKLTAGIAVILTILFIAEKIPAEELTFVTGEWPPFTILKDGQISGINVEIVREFIRRNNLDAKILVVPWGRALKGVEAGKYHAVFTTKKTPEREKFLRYPAEHLQNQPTVIFTVRGKNITAENLNDLKNRKIGVVRGYTYSREFDSSEIIKKDINKDDNMMMRKLAAGRFDLIVGEDIPLKYIAIQIGLRLETVYTLSSDSFYIGFSIRGLGAEKDKLASQFDITMRQMVQEDFVEIITETYMRQ